MLSYMSYNLTYTIDRMTLLHCYRSTPNIKFVLKYIPFSLFDFL